MNKTRTAALKIAIVIIGRFYTRGRIIYLDELFSVVRRSRRTTEDSSSRRIMRLVPVFILETNNQTNNKYFPKFVQTDNASSSIKTANLNVKKSMIISSPLFNPSTFSGFPFVSYSTVLFHFISCKQ